MKIFKQELRTAFTTNANTREIRQVFEPGAQKRMSVVVEMGLIGVEKLLELLIKIYFDYDITTYIHLDIIKLYPGLISALLYHRID